MTLQESYQILGINSQTSREEIALKYKQLAMKWHPDKNRENQVRANEVMTKINQAYDQIISNNFITKEIPAEPKRKEYSVKPERHDDVLQQYLTEKFIAAREIAKDSLYQFYQYNLFDLFIRNEGGNLLIFNEVVFNLRKSYHYIEQLSSMTNDMDFIRHFNAFKSLIFNFYRSTECINIIGEGASYYDRKMFEYLQQGDNAITRSSREIFYDRHNRGNFKKEYAIKEALLAQNIFDSAVRANYPSSWLLEIEIKNNYARALKAYLDIFF